MTGKLFILKSYRRLTQKALNLLSHWQQFVSSTKTDLINLDLNEDSTRLPFFCVPTNKQRRLTIVILIFCDRDEKATYRSYVYAVLYIHFLKGWEVHRSWVTYEHTFVKTISRSATMANNGTSAPRDQIVGTSHIPYRKQPPSDSFTLHHDAAATESTSTARAVRSSNNPAAGICLDSNNETNECTESD
jgi:hypothetical protein